MEFKEDYFSFAKLSGGKLYQPAYHSDLGDIPSFPAKEKFNLIESNLGLKQGKVLDIGANLGYFCFRLEEIGFDCCAVEINPQEVYFLKRLKTANDARFEIFQGSIFDYQKDKSLDFDIVLSLNIFHHFLKRESSYEELKKLLRRLRCQEMFFESHNPGESQMKGAFRNYVPEEFVKFILKNSCLDNYILLKEFPNGRRLYKLFS
jgi:SAM-dependent methyltransferase